MADTARTWSIILAFQQELQAILQVNGYHTDLGKNIWINDHQRREEAALGVMIMSGPITGTGRPGERVGKPARRMTLMLECAIGSELDDAQENIHKVIEDIENCITAYAMAQRGKPHPQSLPPHVDDIVILDRPEGMPVVAMQMQIGVEYFR